MQNQKLTTETVFPSVSIFPGKTTIAFYDPNPIFEFRIVENPSNDNRSEAWDIRLVKEN